MNDTKDVMPGKFALSYSHCSLFDLVQPSLQGCLACALVVNVGYLCHRTWERGKQKFLALTKEKNFISVSEREYHSTHY